MFTQCVIYFLQLSHSPPQYAWCSQVFPDPLDLLSVLFAQSLESLEPPLARCLQAALQGQGGPLAVLTDARQVN